MADRDGGPEAATCGAGPGRVGAPAADGPIAAAPGTRNSAGRAQASSGPGTASPTVCRIGRQFGHISESGGDGRVPNAAKGFVISDAITTSRDNHFSDNTYSGHWEFMYHDQSTVLSLAQWRAEGQD